MPLTKTIGTFLGYQETTETQQCSSLPSLGYACLDNKSKQHLTLFRAWINKFQVIPRECCWPRRSSGFSQIQGWAPLAAFLTASFFSDRANYDFFFLNRLLTFYLGLVLETPMQGCRIVHGMSTVVLAIENDSDPFLMCGFTETIGWTCLSANCSNVLLTRL